MKNLISEITRMKVLAGILKENDLMNELDESEIKKIMNGYIEAALWTEEEQLKDDMENQSIYDDDDDEDEDETEIDRIIKMQSDLKSKGIDSFGKDHITPDSLIQAYLDIKEFIKKAGKVAISEAINENGLERLGHDIWLTRNRHGAGFFDHTYENENELMSAAHNLKEVYIYVDDEGMLRFSNES
jgi:hypothetical protein